MSSDLRTLFDQFIQECKYTHRLRPETLRGYEAVFSIFMKLCPDATLETLAPALITQFYKVLQTRQRIAGRRTIKTGVKDSTIDTYSSKLYSFFKWLVAEGHLQHNPLKGVKRSRPAYDDSKILRKGEVEKLQAAIERNYRNHLQVKRDRAMLLTALLTGLRKNELLGLRVQDVDIGRRQLTVRGETSKSKRTRKIKIVRELLMPLDDYLAERGNHNYTTPSLFVSLTSDRGLSNDGIKHWVANLGGKAGVKFHLHRLRHTFACNAYVACKDPLAIQSLLGHSDLKMTMKYLRSLGSEDFGAAIDGMSVASFM